jgi:glycosyltransferase involved in cell wall biosynthesis
VLGSRIGAIETMLHDGVTGLHFAPGDSQALAEKVKWAWEHPSELAVMGKAGRQVYEEHYTSEINYKLLMNIYASVIEEHKTYSAPNAA